MDKLDETQPTSSSLPPAPVIFWRKHQKIIWIGLIAAAAAVAVAMVYVLVFRNNGNQQGYTGDVSLAIEAPDISASGSEISYEILVKNLTNIKLEGLQLEIFYPKGFTFLDATLDPQEAGGNKFALADLTSQEERAVVIVGTLEGAPQEVKVIGAKLHWVPENFRSSFSVSAQAATEMTAPDLSFRLVAPSHLVMGQKISYEMQITNISKRPFPAVAVKIAYPEKFSFLEANPPAADTINKWELLNIGVNESRVIKASGILSEQAGKEAFASAELFIRDTSGTISPAGRSFAFTQILNSPINLSHRLVNRSDTPLPGEELRYEINYQNVSRVGLNNVVISVTFQTPTVDFSQFDSANGQLAGNAVVWIPAAAPELLTVDPGELGKFDLRIPILTLAELAPSGGSGGGQKNPTVVSRVQFHSKEFPEEIAASEIEVKVRSELLVTAEAAALGGGRYRIDLFVANGVNDVKEAILTATVPQAGAIFFTETIAPLDEQANVQFIPDAGLLRWDLGRVFAFAGSFHEARRLSFVLGGNQSPILLQDIRVEGVDEFTGDRLTSKTIDKVTAR